MKHGKTAKYILAAALAVMLCLAAVVPQAIAYARGKVETGRTCSLTFQIGEEWADLENADITAALYRVAEITEDGAYMALPGFSGLDFSSVSSETSAADWTRFAEEAALKITGETETAATITIFRGKGSVSGLSTGLYLVCAMDAKTPEYTYTFSPYLISLPNNTYYTDGNDEWIYEDVTVSLKPEQTPRYGSLEIVKTLRSYDTALGTALFVFDVEAVKDGRNVYSNVLSLSFDQAGEKRIVVEDIPAGASVTVTEVYSGAGYRLTTEAERTVTVLADQAVQTSFTNEYDGTLTYGSGIVNHFEYDGNGHWSWEQITDNE